jgi:RimJ/RimL family protein N-acetyltransferase
LVLAEPLPPGEALVGAVARASVTPGSDQAEFAILLARQLRGYGLGEYLMRKLILWSKRKRLGMLGGEVLSENAPMLALTEKLGFRRAPVVGEHGLMQVRLPLAASLH